MLCAPIKTFDSDYPFTSSLNASRFSVQTLKVKMNKSSAFQRISVMQYDHDSRLCILSDFIVFVFIL